MDVLRERVLGVADVEAVAGGERKLLGAAVMKLLLWFLETENGK